MEEYAEEDIQVDPADIENAFNRGLKRDGLEYLEEIKKMATNDYELAEEAESINACFASMIRYTSTRGHVTQLKLKDLIKFGLTPDIVKRIGYLAFQYDSISPVNSIVPRKSKGFEARQQSTDDFYADDFEEIEDDAELQTRNESFQDSADELYVEKSPTKQAASGNRYDKRSGVADDDESDIEEETYDMRKNVRTNRQVAPQPNSPPHNAINPNAMYPRISPEVNVHSARRGDADASVPTLKPAVQASSAFLPVSKTGLAKSSVLTPPRDNNNDNSAASSQQGSYGNRASTAGNVAQRVSGSASSNSRVSRNGRIKNAGWIETHSWRLGEKIGSGAFGEVFQGLNDKGTLFAVKRMNMTNQPAEVDNLIQEITLMRGLSHPHIVAYLGAWVDAAQGFLYIFQEWVPGGSVAHLLTRFGPFSLGVVREYTRQIVCGLEYLHNNGIIHRDIKGGNILVDANRTVKLADFGASTTVSSFNQTQVTTTVKGTPYFMAPEVLANSRYGRKGDIWAVGCTMIQMLTGDPPWKDRNLKGLVQLHLLLTSWDQGPPPYNVPVTPDARECLELCFLKNEKDRPTASQLLQCKFLQEDELDESFNNNTMGSHDPLDDSGIITGLKQEMARVVSRSAVGIRHTGTEDTISQIDRQLQEHQRRKTGNAPPHTDNNNNHNPNSDHVPVKGPSPNPYGLQQLKPTKAANPFATPSSSSPEKIVPKWEVELPQSQFTDSPARYSNPVSSSTHLHPGVNTGNSNVNTPSGRPVVPMISMPTPSPSNPFARGNVGNVVRKSTAFSPAAQDHGGRGVSSVSSDRAGSAGSDRVGSGSSNVTPRLVDEFSPRITPRSMANESAVTPLPSALPSKSAGAHGIGAAGVSPLTTDASLFAHKHDPPAEVVRESLQSLKKRNPSAGSSRRMNTANSGSRQPAYAVHNNNSNNNISSNRDSEDLTPYIDDLSDNEDYRYDNNSNNNKLGSQYDAAVRPHPIHHQDSLASIEEEASLANELYRSDDSHEALYANRNTYSNDPPSQSGNSMYTRPKTQSQSARTPVSNVMKKSSSEHFARSEVPNSSYAGNSAPRSAVNTGVNSHVSVSSSASGSVNRYRREVGASQGQSPGQFQVVQVEHRPKPYPTEKKSSSASVRRAAPMSQAEAAHRPNTSKAALSGANANASNSGVGGNSGVGSGPSSAVGGASRNSSAGSDRGGGNKLSIVTGRDTHNRDQRAVAPAEYAYSVDESLSEPDDEEEDTWLCLRCGAENCGGGHCEHCALKRGLDGKRNSGAPIHRA